MFEMVTPCGLYCGNCAFYKDGDVRKHDKDLAILLEGFENLVPIIAEHAPEFRNYEAFGSVLESLSSVQCPGCRAKDVPDHIQDCSFRKCSMEKGVLFCGECKDFPCSDAPQKNPPVAEKWRANGDRLRDIGINQYYEEVRKKPRYLH